MRLDDFVMLGKTIPEAQKKSGRVFVCSAGYSHEMRQLLRIYPLARRKCPPRWSVSQIDLERNPDDSRSESWKIKGDRSAERHEQINGCFNVTCQIEGEERSKIVQSLLSPSIERANERRQSLCVIQPASAPVLGFEENPESPEHPQMDMFDDDAPDNLAVGSKRFAYQPYLEFRDEDGWHNLQIRDWGGYEFMRKHGDDRRHEL
jgi:hypothetical protein